MDLRIGIERLEHARWLDRVAAGLGAAVDRLLPGGRPRDVLHGTWLGHPLHPMLTDVVIGAWSSALVLDLLPARRFGPAADALVGVGLVSAVPTVAAGLADWSQQSTEVKRVGVVHALANATGTVCFTLSLGHRLRGHRGKARAWALAGGGAAAAGGYLGGHLTYAQGSGVSRTAFDESLSEWTPVIALDDLPDGVPTRAPAAGGVLLLRTGGRLYSLADRCSHLGGPLHEGRLTDVGGVPCVVCPWHGSTFRLSDGGVVSGPATIPQARYDVQVRHGRVELRHRPASRSAPPALPLRRRRLAR